MIPELVKRNAEQLMANYCANRIDRLSCPHVLLEYQWLDNGLQIDCRDGCNPPWPVARFLYVNEMRQWFLYTRGANNQWRPYLDVRPTLEFQKLLKHLDDDPFSMFWPPSFTCFS